MSQLIEQIQAAAKDGRLLPESAARIAAMLDAQSPAIYRDSVAELAAGGHWAELNDRFFRTLAFGTGGLRGRTIGKIVTKAERGTPQALDRPEYPCVGTNAMNYYNISRATQGLVRYLKKWVEEHGPAGKKPKLVVAYDTRHFSRDFADLTAKIATENGCDVGLFASPRSTPELSFAVRLTQAQAGIVITASHNPPHDNGYKVYFAEGAQIVEPQASGIIAEVNAITSETYEPLHGTARGEVTMLSEEIDSAYLERLKTLVLDPAMLAGAGADLKIVFTPIHGTGAVLTLPALDALKLNYVTVPAQIVMDGRFPTVKSPNPENAEALSLGMQLADRDGADLVIATDPDGDRMGVAVRDAAGQLSLLTGNQIGSLLAYYRLKTLFEQGVLNADNKARAVIIKTFVTTDLQKSIAEHFGVRCIETLTGFKYIGQKLGMYERALPAADAEGYRQKSEAQTRALRLRESTFYVFGGEESYGYSGADFTRDKDANGAAIMFAEVAAYAKSQGKPLTVLLDEVYATFGFYLEKLGTLTMEGADGAAKIQKLLASYDQQPPTEIEGRRVTATRNFARETLYDIEGSEIPKEMMLMFELADGGKVAVRGSGTEPKIKYYMFAHRKPAEGKAFAAEELAQIKPAVAHALDATWEWLQKDAAARV
jgi:phosphoglucomutase